MYLQSGNVFVKGPCVAFNLKPLRWLPTLFSNFQDLDYYNHSLSVQIKVALNGFNDPSKSKSWKVLETVGSQLKYLPILKGKAWIK